MFVRPHLTEIFGKLGSPDDDALIQTLWFVDNLPTEVVSKHERNTKVTYATHSIH